LKAELPAIGSGTDQFQLTGIEIDPWLKLDHQSGFTCARFAKPNFANGAGPGQAPRSTELTWKIDPHPWTAVAIPGFEEGLKSRTRRGAQQELP
jgi:hypothetical protein